MGWSEVPEASDILEWFELRHGELIAVLDSDLVSRRVVEDFTSDRQVVWLRLSYGREQAGVPPAGRMAAPHRPRHHPETRGGRLEHLLCGCAPTLILPALLNRVRYTPT
jgi:hypothetical protein